MIYLIFVYLLILFWYMSGRQIVCRKNYIHLPSVSFFHPFYLLCIRVRKRQTEPGTAAVFRKKKKIQLDTEYTGLHTTPCYSLPPPPHPNPKHTTQRWPGEPVLCWVHKPGWKSPSPLLFLVNRQKKTMYNGQPRRKWIDSCLSVHVPYFRSIKSCLATAPMHNKCEL